MLLHLRAQKLDEKFLSNTKVSCLNQEEVKTAEAYADSLQMPSKPKSEQLAESTLPSMSQQVHEEFEFQINFAEAAYQKVHVLINQRSMLQYNLSEKVFKNKRLLIEHSIKAEKTEYEEIYLKKIYLCQEMQKFFLKNLAKSNMNAIKEIIKVHCLMEHNLMGNFMPIYGAMTCEDFEYLEAAQSGDHTKLRKYFKEDASTLKQEYTTVRKQSTPVKSSYDAFCEKVSAKLASRILVMRKPLASSRIVERTFTADGNRYFHFSDTGKWNKKLISISLKKK